MSTTTKTGRPRQILSSEIKRLLRKFVIATNKHDHVEMAGFLTQLPPASIVCHDPVFLAIINAGCRLDELRLAEAHGFHFMRFRWTYNTHEKISPAVFSILLQEYPGYANREPEDNDLIGTLLSLNLLDYVDIVFAYADSTRHNDNHPFISYCKSLRALELLAAHKNVNAIYKPVWPAFEMHEPYTALDRFASGRWEHEPEFTTILIRLGMSSRLETCPHLVKEKFRKFHQECIADEDASFEVRYQIFFSRSFTSKLLCALKTLDFQPPVRRLN